MKPAYTLAKGGMRDVDDEDRGDHDDDPKVGLAQRDFDLGRARAAEFHVVEQGAGRSFEPTGWSRPPATIERFKTARRKPADSGPSPSKTRARSPRDFTDPAIICLKACSRAESRRPDERRVIGTRLEQVVDWG